MTTNYVETALNDMLTKQPTLDPELAKLYVLLAMTKGRATTLEDVHDAWAIWRNESNPGHKSLVPFDELTVQVQELDRPYVELIHALAGGENSQPDGDVTCEPTHQEIREAILGPNGRVPLTAAVAATRVQSLLRRRGMRSAGGEDGDKTPTDNDGPRKLTVERAVDSVARQVLANDGDGPAWGNYPEIGEDDWMKVQTVVRMLANETAPSTADYRAAYELLASRATPAAAVSPAGEQ